MYVLEDSYLSGVFFIALIHMESMNKTFFYFSLFDETNHTLVSSNRENKVLFLVTYKNMRIKPFTAKFRQFYSPGPTILRIHFMRYTFTQMKKR